MTEPMTVLNMTRDINGFNSFGLPQSNTIYRTTLSQNVEQHFTVPYTKSVYYPNVLAVFFQDPGSVIFVAINGTATLPGGSFTLGAGEENPSARYVKPGDIISVITSDTTDYFGVALYAVT